MKNYKQMGNHVDLTAPAGGVVSGEGYVIGELVAFALNDAAAAEVTSFVIEGVVEVPLDAATAVTEGALVDWDNTAKDVVATTLGDKAMGVCLETKGAAANQTVLVKLERP